MRWLLLKSPAYPGKRKQASLESTGRVLVFRGFIQVSRDFPRRSIIEATVRSLRVEEGERLVSEEQSDEFQVFPETRRRAETMQSCYVATEGNSPEISLRKLN